MFGIICSLYILYHIWYLLSSGLNIPLTIEHVFVSGPSAKLPVVEEVPIYGLGGVRAIALIDDEDLVSVAPHRWNLNNYGYAFRRFSQPWNGAALMHREIMGLTHGNPLVVDHVNCNRLDNRRRNLEIVTRGENVRRAYQRLAAARP